MSEGGDMNQEISMKDGGANSQMRIDRFENQSGMLTGKVRERGGGSGVDSELRSVSLSELFRTMKTTTSETELGKLRSEKARRWQDVSDKLGDNLNQVREGIESVEKIAEAGQKPDTESDTPSIAKRIAESSGLDNEQQAMLDVVMKDEIRAKFLASGKTPEGLKDDLISQDRRYRVTEISGIPVSEGKTSGRGGRGVEIQIKPKAEKSEEEKLEQAVKQGVLEAEKEKRKQQVEEEAKRTLGDTFKDAEQFKKIVQTVTEAVAVFGLTIDEIPEVMREVAGQFKSGKNVDIAGAITEVRGRKRPKEMEQKKSEEKPKTEEAKPKFSNFQEAYDYLKQNWRSYEVLKPEEKVKFDEAERVKLAAVEAVSRHGDNQYGSGKGMFDVAKQGVMAVMSQLVNDDNYWESVQTSGLPRGDMVSNMARDLEPVRTATPDGTGLAEGTRDAWFDGVVRQWRLAELRAEDRKGILGNRKDRIDELEKEQRFLGWGSVSTPETLLLLDQLADRAASWRIQNDSTLRSWWEAKQRAESEGQRRLGEAEERMTLPEGKEDQYKMIRGKLRIIERSAVINSPETWRQVEELRNLAADPNIDRDLGNEVGDRLSAWRLGRLVEISKAKPEEVILNLDSIRLQEGFEINDVVVRRLISHNEKGTGLNVKDAWDSWQEVNNPAAYENIARRAGVIREEEFKGPINYYTDTEANKTKVREYLVSKLVGGGGVEQTQMAVDSLNVAWNLAAATGETSVWNLGSMIGADEAAKWEHMAQWRGKRGSRECGPLVTLASIEGYGGSWFREKELGLGLTGKIKSDDVIDRSGELVVTKAFPAYWANVAKENMLFDYLMKTDWQKKEINTQTLGVILHLLGKCDPGEGMRLKHYFVGGLVYTVASGWAPNADLGWTPGDYRDLKMMMTKTLIPEADIDKNTGKVRVLENKVFMEDEEWKAMEKSLKKVWGDPFDMIVKGQIYRESKGLAGKAAGAAGRELLKQLGKNIKDVFNS